MKAATKVWNRNFVLSQKSQLVPRLPTVDRTTADGAANRPALFIIFFAIVAVSLGCVGCRRSGIGGGSARISLSPMPVEQKRDYTGIDAIPYRSWSNGRKESR